MPVDIVCYRFILGISFRSLVEAERNILPVDIARYRLMETGRGISTKAQVQLSARKLHAKSYYKIVEPNVTTASSINETYEKPVDTGRYR